MPYLKVDLKFKDYILVEDKLANGAVCEGESYDPIRYESKHFHKSLRKLVNRSWFSNPEYVYLQDCKGKRQFSIICGYISGDGWNSHSPAYIERHVKSIFGWWVEDIEKGKVGYTKFKSRKHIDKDILDNYKCYNWI